MTDLVKLLERVRSATGRDRELDRDIGLAIGGWELSEYATPNPTMMIVVDGDWYPDHPGSMYPAPTESIDAALALTERVLPEKLFKLTNEFQGFWRACIGLTTGPVMRTAPLAIVAATLAALIATPAGRTAIQGETK